MASIMDSKVWHLLCRGWYCAPPIVQVKTHTKFTQVLSAHLIGLRFQRAHT